VNDAVGIVEEFGHYRFIRLLADDESVHTLADVVAPARARTSPVMRCPAAVRCRTRCEPMKPETPVTAIRMEQV
jgi:hypothetical protein